MRLIYFKLKSFLKLFEMPVRQVDTLNWREFFPPQRTHEGKRICP